MANTSLLQVRTSADDKEKASEILEKLLQTERRLTMLRILELVEHPIRGNFDLKHLQAIHKYIFQDVYDWAGEIRKVEIAKGNMFCKAMFIGRRNGGMVRKGNLGVGDDARRQEGMGGIAEAALHPADGQRDFPHGRLDRPVFLIAGLPKVFPNIKSIQGLQSLHNRIT